MAGKTNHIHDSEEVLELTIAVKMNKNTNVARIYKKACATINADWDCHVMDDVDKPRFQNKTKVYKEKQDAAQAPS
jgi:hypothetical protein